MTCPTCGTTLLLGAWPFCPHGSGSFRSVPDDVPGGFTIHNAWTEPRTFYSQSAYEKALAADGMELCPKWVPGSKHLTNWAMTDPQTLENARVLVSRGGIASKPTVTCETLQMTTRVLEGTFTVRADA